MAARLLNKLNNIVQTFEQTIVLILKGRVPPDAFCLAGVESKKYNFFEPKPKFSLKDLVGNGILWAVPKHRRTLEKRLTRKYGVPEYVQKILVPKTTLRTCNTCGDDYEAGVLCPTCYKKVMDETKAMQEIIQNNLGLEPVESEVVVLYSGEKDKQPDETWKGKRIVEIEKERPHWFSQNLLQKTTQQPATSTNIKPSDLG